MGAREPATGPVLFAENCIGARGPVLFAEYKFLSSVILFFTLMTFRLVI